MRAESGPPASAAAVPAPSPDSASASRSAPSLAAQPPQSVSSVRRIGRAGLGGSDGHGPIIGRVRGLAVLGLTATARTFT